MLGGCRHVVAVVEGHNDAYLLGALAPESHAYHYYEDLRSVYEKLWECIYEEQECIIAYIAQGLKKIKEASRKIRIILKTIPDPEKTTCLTVIVDSNSDEPAKRAEEYYHEITRSQQPDTQNADKYFAKLCTAQAKGPKLCTASWRCSAECWIALTTPENPVTNIEQCSPNQRKQCHETAREHLKRQEDKVKTLKDNIKNTKHPWRTLLDNLTQKIHDGTLDNKKT